MKLRFIKIPVAFFSALIFLGSCENVINLKTTTGPELLVVDGWINNLNEKQLIHLSLAGNYFDETPKPALGARVSVIEAGSGKIFIFSDSLNEGAYSCYPEGGSSLGKIGKNYSLQIIYDGITYTAETSIKPVPTIDSLIFQHEELPFEPEDGPKNGFISEFYAKDLKTEGDCYWIKPIRSDNQNSRLPGGIVLAYDAGFTESAETNGLMFIQPIRQSLNSFKLFSEGDTVGLELHSIDFESYNFLRRVRDASTNGGIFSVPLENIPTNLKSDDGSQVLGFFGASAVSKKMEIVHSETARPDDD